MPIRKETEDLLIIDVSPIINDEPIWAVIFGEVLLLWGIFSNNSDSGWQYLLSLFGKLFLILSGGVVIWIGLKGLLEGESVSTTINKKFQSVVMNKKSFVEEIPFSDIKGIVIIRRRELSETKGFFINIIPNYGKYTRIYSTDEESDVERVAEKISKITNKKISRGNIYLVPDERYIGD